MSKYIRTLPENPTFTNNGFKAYQYSLELKEIVIYYIDC